jgi:DNA-binding response OmpR family regulator
MRDGMPGSDIGTIKLLVVDDDARVADTMALIFANHGYRVRVAYSAEQALTLVHDSPPDLALLDVCLPGMNGVDFAILLLASHPRCLVLLLSGQPGSAELVEQAAREGHLFEIVAKPAHPSYLLARAASLLSSL